MIALIAGLVYLVVAAAMCTLWVRAVEIKAMEPTPGGKITIVIGAISWPLVATVGLIALGVITIRDRLDHDEDD